MRQTLEERMKFLLALLKEVFGEASLDLYYNDLDAENPCVAKVHSAVDPKLVFHGRADDFHKALDKVQDWINTPSGTK